MKTLLFVNGPMGVGRTTVCKALLERLTPSVYLDGDWCWNMNPFQVTYETKSMVLDNITAMLSRFLACPELEYFLFSWVMNRPEIAQTILDQLKLDSVKVFQYTLLCTEEVLRCRLGQDIQAGLRGADVLEWGVGYLPLYASQNTIKIMTDGLSPQEIVEEIMTQMQKSAMKYADRLYFNGYSTNN